jgi:thioredoxin reductase (NADPH)
MDDVYNVIVLGGGVAGLSASIWLGRASLKHLVFTGEECNKYGMLSTTSIVENFPGFETIDGKGLIKKFRKQAIKYGSILIEKCITKVDFSNKPFKLYDKLGKEYKTSSVIIATGSVPNRLNLENEEKLWGKYISSSPVSDGPHFKNKRIIVLGGGDSSLESAITLTRFSNKVTLIHRKNTFRASVILQKRVSKNSKINVIVNHSVIKINTENNKLVSVLCQDNEGKEVEIKTGAIFYCLGFRPNSSLFEGILNLDKYGYIIRENSDHFETATSMEGIFSCGDVNNEKYKQAILSSASGVKSALDVNKYLHDIHVVEDEHF